MSDELTPEEISRIAQESGINVDDVRMILGFHRRAELERSRPEKDRTPNHPGRIDVRGVAFLQTPANPTMWLGAAGRAAERAVRSSGTAAAQIVRAAADSADAVVDVVGAVAQKVGAVAEEVGVAALSLAVGLLPLSGFVEAYYGEELVTGRKLSERERVLCVLLELVPVAGKLLKGTRIGVRAAKSIADLASAARVVPATLLPAMAKLKVIAERSSSTLRSAYRKLAKGASLESLPESERWLVREVVDVVPPSLGGDVLSRESRVAGRGSRVAGRTLENADYLRLARLHDALPAYFERYHRLSLDPVTENALAGIFKRTRSVGVENVPRRAASGELKMLEKLHDARGTESIRAVGTSSLEETPDFLVATKNGGYYVETTTPTLAWKGESTPRGVPRPGGEPISREAKNSENLQAFIRKINKDQISERRPGVIAVVLQRVPSAGPILTAKQVRNLEKRIAERKDILELIVVVPGQGPLRVGSRDSGLNLAVGVLPTP